MDAFRKGHGHGQEKVSSGRDRQEASGSLSAYDKGLKAEEAARKEEIAEQTYYRWRREYGGLKID